VSAPTPGARTATAPRRTPRPSAPTPSARRQRRQGGHRGRVLFRQGPEQGRLRGGRHERVLQRREPEQRRLRGVQSGDGGHAACKTRRGPAARLRDKEVTEAEALVRGDGEAHVGPAARLRDKEVTEAEALVRGDGRGPRRSGSTAARDGSHRGRGLSARRWARPTSRQRGCTRSHRGGGHGARRWAKPTSDRQHGCATRKSPRRRPWCTAAGRGPRRSDTIGAARTGRLGAARRQRGSIGSTQAAGRLRRRERKRRERRRRGRTGSSGCTSTGSRAASSSSSSAARAQAHRASATRAHRRDSIGSATRKSPSQRP
jgi:hypothetical protein